MPPAPPIQPGRLISRSSEETEELGVRLAASLRPGDVVLLEGEMGTGKSTLVRGAARALGVSAVVTSPTYTIGHRYEGRVPVAHLDLHRLAGLSGEDPALLEDYLTPDAVAFIEWPEIAESVLAQVRARVRLAHAGGDRRTIEVMPGEAQAAAGRPGGEGR